MNESFNFPSTIEHPDNVYFDTNVISWNFDQNGHPATLGFIQPSFNDVFPVTEGGEDITLTHHQEGGRLQVDELDAEGEVEKTHVLENDGDHVLVPGGKNMRVSTYGKIVEYVCLYPGLETAK